MSKSYQEQLEAQQAQINKAREKLNKLKEKRKIEIGELAVKAGIDHLTDDALKAAFENIAKDHG